jgi:parallel beta-helix repeat protein
MRADARRHLLPAALGAYSLFWTASMAAALDLEAAIAAGRVVQVEPGGPVSSLAEAVQHARDDAGIDTVLLADGAYFLSQPIRLGAEDAGLTIAAAPGATPVLHGGIDLRDAPWTPAEAGIYTLDLAAAGLPRGVLDLHVAGERQTPARHPNATPGDRTSGWLFADAATSGHETLHFRPGDVPEGLAAADLRLWITDDRQWTSNVARVAAIDHQARTLTLEDNVPWHQLGPGSRYFLMGSPVLLDAAGEWAFSAATATLHYRPLDPAVLEDGTSIVAATTDSLIEIQGTRDVTIAGLELRDASPHGSDRGHDYLQIGGGAIRVVDASGIQLLDNRIANVGVGISLLDVEASRIAGNVIEHVAGNGIFVGMPWGGRGSRDVTVENNTIRDAGHTFIETSGIQFIGTSGSQFARNRIEDTAQFGINGAQVRDSGEDAIHDNVIEHNTIRRVNLRSADGGGIKLYARNPGHARANVIRHNWVDQATHLMSRPDGRFYPPDDWDPRRWPQPISAGLYLDWNIEDTLIEGNLVTASYGGILLVNSDRTLVRGNVVAGGYAAAFAAIDQPAEGRPPMDGNVFERNVVLRDHHNAAAVQLYDPTGGPPPARFSGNVYWGDAVTGDAFMIHGRGRLADLDGDVSAWTSKGDAATGEVVADPGFVVLTARDFRLSETTAAATADAGIIPLHPELLERARRN